MDPKNDAIDRALSNYTCPYCRKVLRSASGRTLHLQAPCKGIPGNVEASKKFKKGMTVRYNLKDHKVKLIRDGLVLLDDGSVAAATKITVSRVVAEKPKTKSKAPRTALEWVDSYIKRHGRNDIPKLVKHLRVLFKISGFTSFRKWTSEHLEEALEKRKLVPKRKKLAKKKSAKKKG